MPGKVYLIGMGPGDPELITIKAINAIKSCDLLVYDRLVNKELLSYNPAAELIYVGKESGRHTMSQEDISQLLVEKAAEGRIVGRLKGGDPFVFGRGGEEALALMEKGLEYEIIPGITSAIAVPAYAGIPITHRGKATSFHVITGHEQANESEVDWEALARLKGTLVFLMGVEKLETIAARLMAHGKSENCPAAVIMNGTRHNQREVIGSLKDIYRSCVEEGIKSPAVIVVGEVAALADSLKRVVLKPLSSLHIVSTRPIEKQSEIEKQLRAMGAKVYSYPCIAVKGSEDINLSEAELKEYDAIVFSSSYGVKYFMEHLAKKSIDIRSIKGKLYGVGPSVSEQLQAYGLYKCSVPESYNSKELSKLVRETLNMGSRILVVSGSIGSESLLEQLEGFNVRRLIVYSTAEGNESTFEEAYDAVFFASPSAVRGFIKSSGSEALKEKLAVCIGDTTGEQAKNAGFKKIIIAENSEADSILECIIEWRSRNA